MTTDNDSENDIDRKKRTTITAIGSLSIGLASFVGVSDAAAGRYGRDRRRSHQKKEHGRGGGCGKWCRGHDKGRRHDRGQGYKRDHPHYDDETRWDGDDKDDWRDDERRRHEDEEETDDEPESRDEDPEADDGDEEDQDGDRDDGDEADTEDEQQDSTPDEENNENEEPREEPEEEEQPEDEEQGGESEEREEEGEDEEQEESEEQEQEVDAGTSDVAGRIESRIHAEVNEYRAENGLDALSFDEALADVARSHSQDMNDRGYFSHVDPDGSGPGDRLDAADVDCTGWAENIAYEYDSSFSAEDADSVADSIVQGWINSSGHRRNILGDYDEQGIGVDIRDDGRVMATQLFCTSG